MIRPEARAALSRWAETLAGLAVALLGILWATGSGGVLGWVVTVAGAALAAAGAQRARFGMGGGGPGIVDVTEGRIAYFGPLDGGVVDLDALESLTLDPSGRPAHWVLGRPEEPPLSIPLTAQGADGLFDAFAALPELDTERMLREMRRRPDRPVVIWRRPHLRDTALRLH
ncbi:hypothetical protein [Roseivivax sediminis]|uniref:Uncharacterized protein n=1 Tax=Roseivivax sediminis TaxID=936889 RepID=A0A1I1ZKT7_9RHOB|nr:hypothetical protein [Roseivivax sediminis]SFE31978.1 hypothetical protein SAMN04515678_108171 [Roseivivax sediminis]